MKLFQVGELSLLDKVRKQFPRRMPGVILGIGDDAAAITLKYPYALVTSDMMVEGVHFNFSWTTPYQLGHKLVSVNVSDIYAMGGNPQFMVLNFAANRDTTLHVFERFFEGVRDALDLYGASLIGGDMSSSEKMVVAATVIGKAEKVIRRKGAQTGDKIYVSSVLGDAACGLEIMKRIGRPIEIEKGKKFNKLLKWQTVEPLVKRHLLPQARDASAFSRSATAMMDISDGLVIDLSRLCKESGTGAEIYTQNIPMSGELRSASEYLEMPALDFALHGGEDYELLFTAPKEKKVKAFCIGEITRSGIKIIGENGKSKPVISKGYQHFEV